MNWSSVNFPGLLNANVPEPPVGPLAAGNRKPPGVAAKLLALEVQERDGNRIKLSHTGWQACWEKRRDESGLRHERSGELEAWY